jgi:hypothetical protein
LETSPAEVIIADIIAACGVSEPGHFGRQFGLSPKDVKGLRYRGRD